MTFEFNFKGNERGTIATWQGGSIPIPAHRGEVMECSVIRFPLRFTASLLATLFAVGSMQVVHAAGVPTIIKNAVADNARPDEDKQRDANRKPGETLAFAGVKAGEQIGELLPGRGYFSRIFSKAVGPKGHVFALVSPRSPTAPADQPDRNAPIRALAADPNYSNISVEEWAGGKVSLPAPVDLIFTAQNYHDLHNFPRTVGSKPWL